MRRRRTVTRRRRTATRSRDFRVFPFISILYFSTSGGLDFLEFDVFISYIFLYILSAPWSCISQHFRIYEIIILQYYCGRQTE